MTIFPNTSTVVTNTPLRVVLSTPFCMFENVVKHGLSCLIYYLKRIHRTPLSLRCVCTIPMDEPGYTELLCAGTNDIEQQNSDLGFL